MSNDSPWTSPGWASPGGTPDADAGASAPSGAPSANGASAASGPTAPTYGPAATGGWTPPPKPGLIPLRPIDFGTLFGATFQVLKRNPRPTFGAALLMNAFVSIAAFGAVFGLSFPSIDRLSRATGAEADAIAAGTFGLVLVGALIATAIALVAQALLQGVITIEVSRQILGEKNTLRQLFARGTGRWGALIGWTLVLSLTLMVAIAILFGIIALMFVVGEAAIGGPGAVAVGVMVGIVGGIGMAVLAAWLWIKLAFVPAALMIERLTLGQAIGRAWRLVRGSFWRTFGILLLITFIVQVAINIVSAPFSIAATLGAGLFNPAGDEFAGLGLAIALNVVGLVVTVVVGAIGAVLTAAATALLYTDLRIRREGLDLDLQQAVEQAAAGGTPADPYLRGLDGATRPL